MPEAQDWKLKVTASNNADLNVQPTEQAYSDFGLISALVACSFDIRRTEKEGTRVFFYFNDSNDLQDTVNDYWAGKLMVSARQYFDATKMLKSRIYGRGV